MDYQDEITLHREGYNDLVIRKKNGNWQWLRNITQYKERIWENYPDYFTDEIVLPQIKKYTQQPNNGIKPTVAAPQPAQGSFLLDK